MKKRIIIIAAIAVVLIGAICFVLSKVTFMDRVHDSEGIVIEDMIEPHVSVGKYYKDGDPDNIYIEIASDNTVSFMGSKEQLRDFFKAKYPDYDTYTDELKASIDSEIEKDVAYWSRPNPYVVHTMQFDDPITIIGVKMTYFEDGTISTASGPTYIDEKTIGYSMSEFILDKPQNENSVTELIRNECKKYGICPEIPNYIPDGFELDSYEYLDLGVCDNIEFVFINDNEQINLYYQLYHNVSDIANTGFPSDEFNLEEIDINGRAAITSKEDGQFTLVYQNGKLLMNMFAQNVPYEECDRIVQSIK